MKNVKLVVRTFAPIFTLLEIETDSDELSEEDIKIQVAHHFRTVHDSKIEWEAHTDGAHASGVFSIEAQSDEVKVPLESFQLNEDEIQGAVW